MSVTLHLAHAAKSDVGMKRKNNEDACAVFPDHGIYLVSDGMGGGDDGELASSAVVNAVEEWCLAHPVAEGRLPVKDVVSGVSVAVNDTSKWINDRTLEKGLKGCGATFVAAFFDPDVPERVVAVHAGDSRLYRVRGHQIQQITRDHSVAEMMGVSDERSIDPKLQSVILRAVGVEPSVELEQTPFDVQKGDLVLICSDGLSRMVPDKDVAAICNAPGSLDEMVDALIAAANRAGGNDNVTVVAVRVEEGGRGDSADGCCTLVLPTGAKVRTKAPPRRKRAWAPLLLILAMVVFDALFFWLYLQKKQQAKVRAAEQDAEFSVVAREVRAAENALQERQKVFQRQEEARLAKERQAASQAAAKALAAQKAAQEEALRRETARAEELQRRMKEQSGVERGRLVRATDKENERQKR